MVKEKGAYICESLNSLILSLSAFLFIYIYNLEKFLFAFHPAHENEL